MDTAELKKVANLREQILAGLVMLAIFVMFVRVIYSPKKDEVTRLKSQVKNLKMEKDALDKFTQALRETALKEQLQAAKELPSIKVQVLKGDVKSVAKETPALLSLVTSQPFLKGILVKEMSDLAPKQEKGYKKADFFINAHGFFRNMIEYLDRMRKLPALLVVENIDLKVVDEKAARVELELNGTLFQMEERRVAQ